MVSAGKLGASEFDPWHRHLSGFIPFLEAGGAARATKPWDRLEVEIVKTLGFRRLCNAVTLAVRPMTGRDTGGCAMLVTLAAGRIPADPNRVALAGEC